MLAVVLAVFVMLGVAYSLIVPPFETPDEVYHYAFARHLALGNGLPVQHPEAVGPWEHEGTQAPLYYLLLGPLLAPLNHDDFDRLTVANPRANLGDPHYPGNKNFMLYSTVARPLVGTNLGVHMGRWFSLALSTATLLFIYRIGRLLLPGRPNLALAGTATAAAVPQFTFISASVSNDALMILLATVSLDQLCRLAMLPETARVRGGRWFVLGALLGLTALSKLPGLGLLGLAGIVIATRVWVQQAHGHSVYRAVVRGAAAGSWVLLAFVLVAGWWYVRNMQLYGDWLAVDVLLSIEGARTASSSLAGLWGELRGLRYSFWGIFGWFSILLPAWIYWVLDVMTLGALVGILWAFRRRGWAHPGSLVENALLRGRLCLAAWGVLMLIAMGYWLTFAISSQGRLLFPALAAYMLALVAGLDCMLSRARASARGALWLLPVGLAGCSIYALSVLLPQSYYAAGPVDGLPAQTETIQRTYVMPPPEQSSQEDQEDQPVGQTAAESPTRPVLEVVGVDVTPGVYAIGDTVAVTLYLRKLRETGENFQIFVQVLDDGYQELANVTSHPGWGKHPTTLWETGALYADRYQLRLREPRTGPVQWDQSAQEKRAPRAVEQARLYVGFMTEEGTLLPVPGYEWDIAARTVARVPIRTPEP